MATALASDADILRQIEAFCARHELGVTTFGRNAIGDPNLVGNLRRGRSMTLKTAHSIVSFMTEYQPTKAKSV